MEPHGNCRSGNLPTKTAKSPNRRRERRRPPRQTARPAISPATDCSDKLYARAIIAGPSAMTKAEGCLSNCLIFDIQTPLGMFLVFLWGLELGAWDFLRLLWACHFLFAILSSRDCHEFCPLLSPRVTSCPLLSHSVLAATQLPKNPWYN